jgi:hypothetical protein
VSERVRERVNERVRERVSERVSASRVRCACGESEQRVGESWSGVGFNRSAKTEQESASWYLWPSINQIWAT